jgi:uncharacterized membrane protein
MNNKKISIALFVITLLASFVMITMMTNLKNDAKELGCYMNKDCENIESTLNITHLAFGVIGALLSLSVYLFFLSSGEEAILKKLEIEKENTVKKDRFETILSVLDDYERRVMSVVKEQDGITQNTLRIKTDMSKAKLSYVLRDLEKKNLIKRESKGKTLAVFLNSI